MEVAMMALALVVVVLGAGVALGYQAHGRVASMLAAEHRAHRTREIELVDRVLGGYNAAAAHAQQLALAQTEVMARAAAREHVGETADALEEARAIMNAARFRGDDDEQIP